MSSMWTLTLDAILIDILQHPSKTTSPRCGEEGEEGERRQEDAMRCASRIYLQYPLVSAVALYCTRMILVLYI